MSTFARALRFALRTMVRDPLPSLFAVFALALGIGGTTTVFNVVDGLLFKPLSFPHAERLVQLTKQDREGAGGPASHADYVAWRTEARSFASVSAYHNQTLTATEGNHANRIDAVVTTRELLSVLGVEPALGRDFQPDEDKAGHPRVVLVTHGFWRRHHGADPGILGRALVLDGDSYTVIGVLPANFRFPLDGPPADVLVTSPISPVEAEYQQERGHHYLSVVARLAQGFTLDGARAEVGALHARIRQQHPETESDVTVAVSPLREHLVRDVRPALLALLTAVGFVLLIACTNVASLLLARGARRQREMAIRAALGASRSRLVGQLLTETALLGLAGGALGFLLALALTGTLGPLLPVELQRFRPLDIDGRMMAVALVISLSTSVVFGLLPAIHVTRGNLQGKLAGSGRSAQGQPARHRALRGLCLAEIAMAVALLVGAGLMARSFVSLRRVDPGFAARGLLTANIELPGARYGDEASILEFRRRLLTRLTAFPGIERAAIGTPLPLSGINFVLSLEVDGDRATKTRRLASLRSVSPEYFGTLDIPLLQGRLFGSVDDHERAPPVLVINQTFARKYFGQRNPVGRRVTIQVGDKPESHEILGVVADVHHAGLHRVAGPEMYVPFARAPASSLYVVLRTPGSAQGVAGLRTVLREIDGAAQLGDLQTMEEALDDSLGGRRIGMLAMVVFALVALVLAVVGIYAMVSYSVSLRVQEIGVRMALGAQRRDVLVSIVGGEVGLALVGVALGLGAALALSGLLKGLLFGVPASDPVTYAVLGAGVLAVVALASYLPARRAAALDPMVALRG